MTSNLFPEPDMNLSDRIQTRNLRYGVLGLGYVGLPLAVAFAERGVRVTGFDVDGAKVEAVAAGRSYLPDVSTDRIAAATASGMLTATTDFPWNDVAEHAALVVDARGAVPKDRVRGTLVGLSGPACHGVAAPDVPEQVAAGRGA